MSNLTRYSPATSTPQLFNHRDEFVTSFDRLFNQLFEDVFPETTKELGVDLFSKGSYPKVNVVDEDKQVVITAEIPGLSREQVNVEIQEGVLTIKGNKREDVNKDDNKKKYIYHELKQSSFSRSFNLHDSLDADKVKAKFESGMLELTIPKKIPDVKLDTVRKIKIE